MKTSVLLPVVWLLALAYAAQDEMVWNARGEALRLTDAWKQSRVALLSLAECKSRRAILAQVDARLVDTGVKAFCRATGGETPSAQFIDSGGVVRRAFQGRAANETFEAFVEDIRAWFDGKAVYEGACARCHGADGNDTSYSGIKRLGGIGKRHSEAEIVHLAEMTGNNDLHALSEKDRRALGVYVSGL
jgi:mono/diheme cytochrome c family protein